MKNDLATGAVLADQCTNSWVSRAHLRLIGERVGTPVFVYSEKQLVSNIARIKEAAASAGIGKSAELDVPFFPTSNPHALPALPKLGIGVLVPLPHESKRLRLLGFNN